MKHVFIYLLIFGYLNASSRPVGQAPVPVAEVELSRYLGSWYELRRIPNSFQDNTLEGGYGVCFNTIAGYTARGNSSNKLNVTNTCYRFNSNNETYEDVARAKGEVVKNSGNAKLKVNFTGSALLDLLSFGDADYWILGLGPINSKGFYSWAFVGTPNRKFGWILSRTKTLPSSQKQVIAKLIVEQGYDPKLFKEFRK